MKIINLLCDAQNNGSTPNAVKELRRKGYDIDVWQFGISDVDSNERYFHEIVEQMHDSELMIIRMHAGLTYFKKFERLKEQIVEHDISVLIESEMTEEMIENRSLFKGSDDEYVILRSYIELGGEENEYNLLAYLLKECENAEIDVRPPKRRDAQGPYLSGNVVDPSIPTVGILIGQTSVIDDNTEHIDSLISSLKGKGVNVCPVFMIPNPGEITGSIGINGCVRRYFMDSGQPSVDVLIVTMGFSMLCMSDPGDGTSAERMNIFAELGVPVIQASSLLVTEKEWMDGPGFGPFEISMNVFWPEYDGQIISFPFASSERSADGKIVYTPIPDRIEALSDLAVKWARLRRTPVEKRKVAILMHQNPPRNDMMGNAFGLDAPESVARLLKRMNDVGYALDTLPDDGQQLISMMLKGTTNDTEWLSDEDIRKKAAAIVPPGIYAKWFSSIDKKCQTEMLGDWGSIPGTTNTTGEGVIIPGLMNGNIFIGMQPDRGMGDGSKDIYHSQDITAPHHYLAYYRWLSDIGMQAIIHMGCHGTMEWLPGKGNGLSGRCFPDVVWNHVPHIYPYAISNPGEGEHAKRRTGAVIVDHLIPAHTRADSYDTLEEIESLLQEYLRSSAASQKDKVSTILYEIFDKCIETSLLGDIGLTQHSDITEFEEKVRILYDYICEIKDNTIKDGLHVLGKVPEDKRMDEMIYCLTRLDNNGVPSLRRSVAEIMGIDLNEALSSPSVMNDDGKTNGELVDAADTATMELITEMRSLGFKETECIDAASSNIGMSDDLAIVMKMICNTLVPSISATGEEIDGILDALNGRYVEPGPSGCPTRGNAHLLPTGKNFFSIDPASIPTRSSWNMGCKMADQMIDRYVKDNGAYPKQIGIVIWATDTMKTGGDDIAYILWLLGVRPKWTSAGSAVTGFEIIPVEELKRPRIDVTLRISGLFRDSFPNLVEMIDDAVNAVSELNESDENNYLLKNLREDIAVSIADGIDAVTASKKAKIRIFGDPPGNYGGGIDTLIETSAWKERKDLADAFVEWGGYAYGRNVRGEDMKEFFKKRLQNIDVTVKNHESRELDAFDNDDDYVFLGGMNAAVESFSGKRPESMIGDSSDPDRPRTRTLQEESKFIFRSRVLNPKWIAGLKEHGYRGVQELTNLVEFSFGWDSTSGIMEDWMYRSVTERFLFDGENRQWIQDNNPDALHKMTSRLLEAIERGMWNADDATEEKLRSMFLESEDALERANDR